MEKVRIIQDAEKENMMNQDLENIRSSLETAGHITEKRKTVLRQELDELEVGALTRGQIRRRVIIRTKLGLPTSRSFLERIEQTNNNVEKLQIIKEAEEKNLMVRELQRLKNRLLQNQNSKNNDDEQAPKKPAV